MDLVIRLILITDSAWTILSPVNNDIQLFSLQSLHFLTVFSCLIVLGRREVVMVEILTSFPDTGEKVSYFTMKCDVNWKVS